MSEDEKKHRILHIDSISITRSGGDNGFTPPEKREPDDLECGPPDTVDKPNSLADLFRGMEFSRGKPTASGHVPGTRDRFGNVYQEPDPKIVRRVFPGGVLDYSKLSAEMLGKTWQDIEMQRIKDLIKDNPDMANDELYMLVMGLSSGPALYRAGKCPKCNQGDSEKD